MENIFTNVIFTDYILPWVLLFVIVFAILEKTNLLGEGKRQINAIIGAVVGLIVLAFPAFRDVITGLIPYFAVVLIAIFVFLLLFSFASGETKGNPLGKTPKIIFGIVLFIGTIIAVLILTGSFDKLVTFFSSSNTGANIIFVVIAIAAVAAVLYSEKGKDKD